MTDRANELMANLKGAKKLICKEMDSLLDSINEKISNNEEIKKNITKADDYGYQILEQMFISHYCSYSDYGHDQYVLGIVTEYFKLDVRVIGCGNSEVDYCDTDSCMAHALETATEENIKKCFDFLLKVDYDLDNLKFNL